MDAGSNAKKENEHRKLSDDFEEVKVELVDDRGKNMAHTKMNQVALNQIEDCGYPHEYIVDSIRTEQLNHVTAFYNLIITKFEY
jgi:predicted nucleotidyltransferase